MREILLTAAALMMLCTSCFSRSGTCGENLTWTLSYGVLTVSGTGAMTDYYYDAPWSNSKIKTVVIENGVTSIGNYAFYRSVLIDSVVIKGDITSIGDHAFTYCEALDSITLPGSITSIGGYAFWCCGSLASVTIPGSVTSIGDYAFSNCKSLYSVTVGDGVTSIGNRAFNDCGLLASITIPGSVTGIGRWAFNNCKNIVSVINLNPAPQNIKYDVFCNLNLKNIVLYVPSESLKDYMAAEGWKEFGKILPYKNSQAI